MTYKQIKVVQVERQIPELKQEKEVADEPKEALDKKIKLLDLV